MKKEKIKLVKRGEHIKIPTWKTDRLVHISYVKDNKFHPGWYEGREDIKLIEGEIAMDDNYRYIFDFSTFVSMDIEKVNKQKKQIKESGLEVEK